MTPRDSYDEIKAALKDPGTYSGRAPHATLARTLAGYRLKHGSIVGMVTGSLEDTAMVLGMVPIRTLGTGTILMPAPGDDEGFALLTPTSYVIAGYERSGRLIHTAWDAMRTYPSDRESILCDLHVDPGRDIPLIVTSVEIASRYLIETRRGVPMGLEPEGI